VTTLSLFEVVERIRGETGTAVVLTLFRPDTAEHLELSLVRAKIKIDAATWAMVPGTRVALIRLAQFSQNLNEDVVKAIQQAQAEGATALILDVRNNPGGLLQQAIAVTSQFLKDGDVLLQEDASGRRETFPVEPGGAAPAMPLMVLVNRGSASSAEILAGAIQDHRRGTVIGETTFGAGTVLEPFYLADGSLLLLGAGQWLTPNGRLIRQQGIEPDIMVELPAGSDLITPSELKETSLAELPASEDKQLLKALEVLDALPQAAKIGYPPGRIGLKVEYLWPSIVVIE
jgi:carboxyl-terminal processing protease